MHHIAHSAKGYVRCTCGSEFDNEDDWLAHATGEPADR
jgi:hypothetical protein